MPFSRQGIWTVPVEADHSNFHNSLMSTRQEIAPTEEMIEAITANLPQADTPVRKDIFGAIGKLKGPVDIIIPVYGGLHVLKPCIASVVKHTKWDYRLIIVDDCSTDPAVREYLKTLSADGHAVLYNRKNRGFAPTVNRGVAAGDSPYVCVLNSDTLVTEGWLTRQLMALEADEKNVIVNPVTNNTALVNVNMYAGSSYKDMAHALAVAPNTLTYNEIMPTGFCFTMRRKLWNEIGPFDEAYISYGEETDFWFKAIKQTDENGVILRNRGVIADNAYVFHERGTSFSQLGSEKHMGLRRSGSSRFNEIHPDFASWQQGFSADGSVNHLRNHLPKESFKNDYKGNIAWVVKSAGLCGGMNFITDIVNELIEQGYNAKVCVVPDSYDEENPPELSVVPNLRTSPILFKSREEFTSTFKERVFVGPSKVFAAVTELSPLVWDLTKSYNDIEGFNHVQSYDPQLAEILGVPELVPEFEESYRRLPNLCSSRWVGDTIKAIGGEVLATVLPGVNPDLFHPRDRSQGDERFTIAILYNSMYAFKGAKWADEFIAALAPEKHPELRVLVIGPKNLDVRGVTCLGDVSQAKMADLLGGEVDVLVDPAQVHSYGMPALEALASGCRVLCRENGGINEIKSSWNDRVFIDDDPYTSSETAKWLSLDDHCLDRITGSALVPGADRKNTVQAFIYWAFPQVCNENHRIEVITPHLRKHGGPTTIIAMTKQLKALGHGVTMSTVYTDWSPEVLNMAEGIDVRTAWKDIPEDVEVVIINSDNPFAKETMERWPDKKYVMFKLSHNPRFQEMENANLKLNWAHIMTSTEWLRQACMQPHGGKWDHRSWTEEEVTTVGWYHYGHEMFNMPPTNRTYGDAKSGFRLGTLIHGHPLKGSQDAMGAIDGLKKKYEANFHAVGFGELKANIPWHMQYFRNSSRSDMAFAFKQLDVWYGASHSEGLGRMALEAMSAGAAVITTDTGAEFLKHGENCMLYPIGDAQKGAEMVDKLVNDQDLFSKIILGGHATATNAASPKEMRNKLDIVIRKVLEQ